MKKVCHSMPRFVIFGRHFGIGILFAFFALMLSLLSLDVQPYTFLEAHGECFDGTVFYGHRMSPVTASHRDFRVFSSGQEEVRSKAREFVESQG